MTTEVHPRVGANYFHRAGRSTKRHNLLRGLHFTKRKGRVNATGSKTQRERRRRKGEGGGKKEEALLVRGRHRGSLSLLLPAVVPPSPVLPHKFSPSKNSRPAKSVPHSRQRQKRSRERWGSLYKDLRPDSNLKSLGPNAFNNWRRCNTFENWCPQKAHP